MDEAEANFHDRDRENEARRATNPVNATKPMSDLDRKNQEPSDGYRQG